MFPNKFIKIGIVCRILLTILCYRLYCFVFVVHVDSLIKISKIMHQSISSKSHLNPPGIRGHFLMCSVLRSDASVYTKEFGDLPSQFPMSLPFTSKLILKEEIFLFLTALQCMSKHDKK